MNKRVSVALVILSLALLFTLTSAVDAAEQRSFVISNSKDWKEIYVAAAYAGVTEADYFFFFSDLADAEMKTKMMTKNDMVTVFESSERPIIKNYDSRLDVNGYDFVASNKYSDLTELQETVYEMVNPEGFVVFGTDYGVEPVAALPFLIQNKFTPFFYTEDSADYIQNQAEEQRSIFIGRIPVRNFELDNKETFLGGPIQSTFDVTEEVNRNIASSWGVMTRIDQIEFQSLLTGRPVFLHFGTPYMEQLAQITRDSGIERFEVIGGDMVSIAQDIESATGEDLKFMLKYGRKVTNYAPMAGDSILDIDSIELPRPIEYLSISGATYYPELDVLALNIHNQGNIDELVYSNMEFGDESFSDEQPHQVPAQQNMTFTYTVNMSEETPETIIITSRYGSETPLTINIEENGSQIIEQDVVEDPLFENHSLLFNSARLNTENGDLAISIKNNASKQLIYYAELVIDDGEIIRSSNINLVDSGAEDEVIIGFPYIPNDELLNKTVELTLRYGTKDTILTTSDSFIIKADEQTSDVPGTVVIALAVVAVVLILLLLLIGRKKKNSSENDARSKPEASSRNKKKSASTRKKSSSSSRSKRTKKK
ncbi:MAG: hypothetical protein ACQESE_00260 [Nanobdellota archaeon]